MRTDETAVVSTRHLLVVALGAVRIAQWAQAGQLWQEERVGPVHVQMCADQWRQSGRLGLGARVSLCAELFDGGAQGSGAR